MAREVNIIRHVPLCARVLIDLVFYSSATTQSGVGLCTSGESCAPARLRAGVDFCNTWELSLPNPSLPTNHIS